MERFKGKRKGHRAVVTRNINGTRGILEGDAEGLDASTWNRLEVIDCIGNKKRGILAGFDEEIQQRCDIKEEIVDEIMSRILKT